MEKSFEIPKQLVWEAYLKVKANGGAAGVDEQSIEEFAEDLKGNLYKILESDVLRQLFSAAGAGRADTEEVGRKQNAGDSNCRRQSSPDDGEAVG